MKKSNVPKLLFFSASIAERFDIEIYRVVQLCQSERITFQRANEMLHDGKEDLQTIHYHTQCQISGAETVIIDLRRHGRFNGDQLGSDNILSLATRRAIVSMRSGLDSYKTGVITKRQLRRAHKMMKDLLDQDVSSLCQEIRDAIKNLKAREEKEPYQEIPESDMLIKKVSKVPTPGSAHDDLA